MSNTDVLVNRDIIINFVDRIYPAKNNINIRPAIHNDHYNSKFAKKLRNGTLNRELLENWNENV